MQSRIENASTEVLRVLLAKIVGCMASNLHSAATGNVSKDPLPVLQQSLRKSFYGLHWVS